MIHNIEWKNLDVSLNWKKMLEIFSRMVVQNGDESRGRIRKKHQLNNIQGESWSFPLIFLFLHHGFTGKIHGVGFAPAGGRKSFYRCPLGLRPPWPSTLISSSAGRRFNDGPFEVKVTRWAQWAHLSMGPRDLGPSNGRVKEPICMTQG